jgi:hypothetical protein
MDWTGSAMGRLGKLGVARWIGRALRWDGSAMDGSASAMYGSASHDGLDGLGKGRLSSCAMNGSALHVDWTCINGVCELALFAVFLSRFSFFFC